MSINELIPKRTKFYNLHPIGLGTEYVESLTSYLLRLSQAHGITLDKLISKEFAESTDRDYLKKNMKCGFYQNASGLNGTGELVKDITVFLSDNTGVKRFDYLTMLPLRNAISSLNLLKKEKAWCPLCLENWRAKGKEIYEPLIWFINPVEVCPMHKIPLKSTCPSCNRSIRIITKEMKIGFCPRCGSFLGMPKTKNENSHFIDTNLIKKIGISVNIGHLLAGMPSMIKKPSRQIISNLLMVCLKKGGNGNRKKISEFFNVSIDSLMGWIKCTSSPSIQTVLKISQYTSQSLIEIFSGGVPNNFKPSDELTSRSPSVKRVFIQFDRYKAEQFLDKIISDNPDPFPSLKEVSRQSGFSVKSLNKHLPHLSARIKDKHLESREKHKKDRLERLCKEVRDLTIRFHNEGLYPGQNLIKKHGSIKGILSDKAVRDEWNKTLSELGYR